MPHFLMLRWRTAAALSALTMAATAPLPATAQPATNTQAPNTQIQNTAPFSDPSAIAPKPTAEQFAEFKAAWGKCTSRNGDPSVSAQELQDMHKRIDLAQNNIAALSPRDQELLLQDTVSLLITGMPHYTGNQDTLTPAIRAKVESGGIPPITPPQICPYTPNAALPMLQWIADRNEGARMDRSIANAFLGLMADYTVGLKGDTAPPRTYFLKSLIFSYNDKKYPFAETRFWSDGKDNDLFGNIERQGLQPYFDRAMAGPTGYFIRVFTIDALAQSDPDKARSLLMAGNPHDSLTLLELEEKGSIPARHTQADLTYWLDWVQRSAPDVMRRNASKILPRIAATAAHLNGGTLAVSAATPTIAQAYSLPTERDRTGGHFTDIQTTGGPRPDGDLTNFDPAKPPTAMRALIGPDGKALIVVECGRIDSGTYEEKMRIIAFARRAHKTLKPLIPATINGQPAYTWIPLPGTPPTKQTPTCTTNPLLHDNGGE